MASHILSSCLLFGYFVLIASGIFPSLFKQDFVFPISKSWDRIISRITDWLSFNQQLPMFRQEYCTVLLLSFMEVLSLQKHEFFCSRFTVSNPLEFQDCLMLVLCSSCQVHCVYLDLSKAFYRVFLLLHLLVRVWVALCSVGWTFIYAIEP